MGMREAQVKKNSDELQEKKTKMEHEYNQFEQKVADHHQSHKSLLEKVKQKDSKLNEKELALNKSMNELDYKRKEIQAKLSQIEKGETKLASDNALLKKKI